MGPAASQKQDIALGSKLSALPGHCDVSSRTREKVRTHLIIQGTVSAQASISGDDRRQTLTF